MTVEELFKKIWSMPPMPYRYWDNKKNGDRYPILGDAESCQPTKERPQGYQKRLDELITLYEKGIISDDEKKYFAKKANLLKKACAFHYDGYLTKDEQLYLLRTLDSEDLNDIEKQYEMYMTARKYYKML